MISFNFMIYVCDEHLAEITILIFNNRHIYMIIYNKCYKVIKALGLSDFKLHIWLFLYDLMLRSKYVKLRVCVSIKYSFGIILVSLMLVLLSVKKAVLSVV